MKTGKIGGLSEGVAIGACGGFVTGVSVAAAVVTACGLAAAVWLRLEHVEPVAAPAVVAAPAEPPEEPAPKPAPGGSWAPWRGCAVRRQVVNLDAFARPSRVARRGLFFQRRGLFRARLPVR